MPGWIHHSSGPGSFKSIPLLKVPRNVTYKAHCLRDCPFVLGALECNFYQEDIKETRRGIILLGSTLWKERGVIVILLLFVVVVTIIVSWVPPTKTCLVALKRLSGQMLPVTSDECPAPLKSRSGFMKRWWPCQAWGPASPGDGRFPFLSAMRPASAVALSSRHPEMGLLHPRLWKNKVRRAEAFVDHEQGGLVKPILRHGFAQLSEAPVTPKRCAVSAHFGTDTVKVASGPLLYNPSLLYN